MLTQSMYMIYGIFIQQIIIWQFSIKHQLQLQICWIPLLMCGQGNFNDNLFKF